ncbi:hypothetical protein F4824DRAFT_456336 [Ustulina deusta]|nr:hypothetical protein F4824DRAFT_456336 [Ustulina deusta]
MLSHFKEKHAPARSFLCTYDGCEVECRSQKALTQHQRKEHLKLEFKCPVEGCSKTLTSRTGINLHVKAVHGDCTYSCHFADCEMTYTKPASLANHLKLKHSTETEFPCFHQGCELVYASAANLAGHIEEKHHDTVPVIHRCPLADREQCMELYSSPRLAALHANVAHCGKFPCSLHKESGCEEFFRDKESASGHALKHRRYICSVLQCVDAVMGRARS